MPDHEDIPVERIRKTDMSRSYYADIPEALRQLDSIAEPVDVSFGEEDEEEVVYKSERFPESDEKIKAEIETHFQALQIGGKSDEVVKDETSYDEPVEDPLKWYARRVVEMPPGIMLRAFLNDNEKRGSNYGIEMTITGHDLMTLSYQVYRAIDLLSRDMPAKDSDNLKRHFDDCTDQLKEISNKLISEGKWKPLRIEPIDIINKK